MSSLPQIMLGQTCMFSRGCETVTAVGDRGGAKLRLSVLDGRVKTLAFTLKKRDISSQGDTACCGFAKGACVFIQEVDEL